MDFGQVVNLFGRRELSEECKTKKCCKVCLSESQALQSQQPQVCSCCYLCGVCCTPLPCHPGAATTGWAKLPLGIFREEPDCCAISTHVRKLYIAAAGFSFPQSGYEETIHCVCSGRSEFSVWDDCKSGCSYPGFRDS